MTYNKVANLSFDSFRSKGAGKKVVLLHPRTNYRNLFITYFLGGNSKAQNPKVMCRTRSKAQSGSNTEGSNKSGQNATSLNNSDSGGKEESSSDGDDDPEPPNVILYDLEFTPASDVILLARNLHNQLSETQFRQLSSILVLLSTDSSASSLQTHPASKQAFSRQVILLFSFLILVTSLLWLRQDASYEPFIAMVSSLIAILSLQSSA